MPRASVSCESGERRLATMNAAANGHSQDAATEHRQQAHAGQPAARVRAARPEPAATPAKIKAVVACWSGIP